VIVVIYIEVGRNKLISHLLYNFMLNPLMAALSNPFRRGSQDQFCSRQSRSLLHEYILSHFIPDPGYCALLSMILRYFKALSLAKGEWVYLILMISFVFVVWAPRSAQ